MAIPKTFTAGERLFAADLNDDFNFLDGKISSIDASQITSGKINQARLPIRKVVAFKANSSFVVPAGVSYVVANVRGGGGGVGLASGGNGSLSRVAGMAIGNLDAAGGPHMRTGLTGGTGSSVAAPANSGGGANLSRFYSISYDIKTTGVIDGAPGAQIVCGSAVTPGNTLTITVGAGGSAGTGGSAGGSGYVYLEFEE